MAEYTPKYTRDWKKWGKQPNSAMRHQDDHEECPACAYRIISDRISTFYPYVVGYQSQKPYFNRVGMIVIECPKCFEFFTSHVHTTDTFLAEQVLEHPDYFKIPKARKALLQMLEEKKECTPKDN